MRVRPEERGDERTVDEIVRSAFEDDGDVVAELVRRLRALVTPTSGASLVAVDGAEVVGHVMFTRSVLDAPRRLVDVQILSPLAVVPARQGTSIGGALVTAGLAQMEAQGAPVVFLEGPPSYYGRFGFAPGEPQGFRKPSLRIPDAAFQAVRLSAHEPWMTGTLVYAHEFWDLDAVGLRDPEA